MESLTYLDRTRVIGINERKGRTNLIQVCGSYCGFEYREETVIRLFY